eukprot:TCONS_00010247-protein
MKFLSVGKRFFSNHSAFRRMLKMGDILEEHYQNGLTNYSNPQNKQLIKNLMVENDHVFSSEDQIKRWIYRRKANEKKNTLSFPHTLTDGTQQPKPIDVTSLNLPVWKHYLEDCPMQDRDWVLDGIQNGFSLDFDSTPLSSASKNLLSAHIQPGIIDDYLEMELKQGTMLGPYKDPPYDQCQINRFGVIPKSDGKFRMITDLSFPLGESVNDGISKENSTVSYTGLTAAVKKILALGKGCLLAKFDIQRAYRMIPLQEDERNLVVIKWKDYYFVDLALPFGARSAPRIFTRFSDVLEWIFLQKGPVKHMQHSLDDFLVLGLSQSNDCQKGLENSLGLCQELGVPIEHRKTIYPTTRLVFLGMEIDTEKMEMRIPEEKLDKIRQLLDQWVQKKSGTKRSLLSLIGSLYYCCQAVVVGKPFMIRLTKKAYSVDKLHFLVKLDEKEIEDLMWWYYLLNSWNGRSLMSNFDKHRNVVKLHS